MYFKLKEICPNASDIKPYLEDNRFNDDFKTYVANVIFYRFYDDYFIYYIDSSPTAEENLESILLRYFPLCYQQLINVFFLYMKSQNISTDFNVSGGSEKETTERTIDYTNDIFRKYAQTPTAVSPSTNFVDSYTDMQEKTTGNDNTEESVTKNRDKIVSDKEINNFYRMCNVINSSIQKIFSNQFLPFYYL